MASQPELGFIRLTENAIPPVRASSQAAGFDLSAAYDQVVPKRGKALIKTDLALIIPENCYGRIAPRSGLAAQHFIDVGAGVIDRDYTGNVKVLLFNHSDIDFHVKQGNKIAQLICEVIKCPPLRELSIKDLENTERGKSGFGSTGI